METFYLWSATLDKANKVKEWASSDDEDDRILSFSNVFLGDSSKEYELNVVNIEYTDVDGEDVSSVFLCPAERCVRQSFHSNQYL